MSAGVGVGAARRALDVVVSAVALVVLSPLLLLVAAVVRLDSPGPVIYRHVRLGQGRREITIFKFRSMRLSTQRGPEVTKPGDPRVTRAGAVLRRTSIDELPQLLNVLRGQMTLVGPRPETPSLAARYPEYCCWVLDHRPGLTGPSQIRFRDADVVPADIDDPERWYLDRVVPSRVMVDGLYLSRPSLGATLRVVWETVLHLTGLPVPQAR